MSPELETLDQLLGGEMPLLVLRQVYPDDTRFTHGILGLLSNGDFRLLRGAEEVSRWEWTPLLLGGAFTGLTLTLTEQGGHHVA